MSDSPRHTPQAHDLFMAAWQAKLFTTGRIVMDAAEIVHWAKTWVNCCEIASRLEEMEENAAAAEAATPSSWPPTGPAV